MGEDESQELRLIVNQPSKRPYGARVRFHLRTEGALGGAELVCVPLPTGALLSIAPTTKAPWEGGKKYLASLEGFPTATAAEAAGQRLVQALLWMSVSSDTPLKLEYESYRPASVFQRGLALGVGCIAYGEAVVSPKIVFGELHDAYASLDRADEKLILSMEIFCGAQLESSQRATFLAVVSALEPLADAASLGPAVADFVKDCAQRLKENLDIDTEAKRSLHGRLLHLREESIRSSLRRLMRESLTAQPEAAELIDRAYSLRSEIVHSGSPADPDTDLEQESQQVRRVVRSLYASLLKRSLARAG